jgi:hypothetical protein
MQTLLASAVVVMVTSSTAAATPEVAPSVTLSVGSHLGRSNHPDDGGFARGLYLGAEVQLWWLILGGTLGADAYPSDGAPVRATTSAAYLGMGVPLYRSSARHVLELRGAVEIGRHDYSASGKDSQFLGGTSTYEGATRKVGFAGARGGLSYSAVHFDRGISSLVFALEVLGRSDRGTVDLPYVKTQCGGLFNTGCNTSTGTATAGGQELSLVASCGLVFGR